MATPPHDIQQWVKKVNRELAEVRRNSQASLVGYVNNKVGDIQDQVNEIDTDTRIPTAPVEIVIESFNRESFNNKLRQGFISVTFPPVTKATDATDIQVGSYELWMRRQGDDDYFLAATALTPVLTSPALRYGATYEVIVRALTLTKRSGNFSEIMAITITGEDPPPPMPSMLVASQRLGTVHLYWDGLTFGDTVMPVDFDRSEVGIRAGADVDYVPIGDGFLEAGYVYYSNAPFGEQVTFSHRAYDYAGGVSDWAQGVAITVDPVVDTSDLERRLTDAEELLNQTDLDLQDTKLELSNRLTQAEADLTAAESSLNNLNTVVIPQLDADLDANESTVNNLNTVVIPGLNTRLDEAESELSTTKLELDGRLDTAESDISAAESSLTNIKDVQIPALNTRLGAAETELSTTKTQLSNRLTEAESGLTAAEGLIDQLEDDVVLAAKTAAIENLYVTGVGTINEAVIDKLWADVIRARKITTDMLLVGQGTNFLADPDFDDPEINEIRTAGTSWIAGTGGTYGNSISTNSATAADFPLWNEGGGHFPVEPDGVYGLTIYANGPDQMQAYLNCFYEDGYVNSGPTIRRFTGVSGGAPKRYTVSWDMATLSSPSGAPPKEVTVNVRRMPTPAGETSYYGFIYSAWFGRLTDGALVVNGSIDADKINTNSIVAEVGKFLKLDVSSLVASSASINSGVIDKLWADVIRARKITTDMLLVGGNGDNLIKDPLFTDSALNLHRQTIANTTYDAGWYWTGTYWYSRSNPADGEYRMWFPNNFEPPGASAYDTPVTPGITYRFRVYVFITGDGASASMRATIRIKNQDGSTNYLFIPGTFSAPSGWSIMTWDWTPSDEHAFAMPEVVFQNVSKASRLAVRNPSFKPKVDGSLIVNGSITGDHLEVNSVAAKVATVIELSATRITSGTINTSRLSATGIAAATANIQTVNVSNLFSTSATISTAVVDKLWAEVVNAKKITADMVVIGAGNNIIPNAKLAQGEEGWSSSEWGLNVNNGPGGLPSIWAQGRTNSRSQLFVVEPGQTYKFRVAVQAQYAGTRFYVQVNTNGSTNPYAISNQSPPTGGWTYYTGEVEMSATATTAYINVYVNHPNGTSTTGYQWYSDWSMIPMASGELIVSGAVTATHITASSSLSAKIGQFLTVTTSMLEANAVKAGNIDTGAITAAKIAGGAIDGKVITGATIRTSSSSSRIEMSGTTIRALQGGTEFFSVDPTSGTVNMRGSFRSGSMGGLIGNTPYFINMGADSGGTPSIIMGEEGGNVASYLLPSSSGVHFISGTSVGGTYRQSYGFTMNAKKFAGSTSSGQFALWYYDLFGELPTSYDIDQWYALTLSPYGGDRPPVLRFYESYNPDASNQIPKFTGGSPLVIDLSAGTHRVGIESSLSRYKLNQRVIPEDMDDKILSIETKTWFDKEQAEMVCEAMRPRTYQEAIDMMTPLKEGEREERPFILRRVPGVIAEDVRDAGLTDFLSFGVEEMTGVQYDRLGVALIPVVRRQRDRIITLEDQLASLLERVTALEMQ